MFFAENVAAIKDLWIIGDDFVRDTYKALPALKRRNTRNHTTGPYMMDTYNVIPLMYQKNGNIFANLLNNLIDGLNEIHKIPRIILIMPDKSIIKGIKHEEYGVSKILGICLNHLVKQLSESIERKKQCMELLKPGSITPGEPKFIWLKMIDRPNKKDKSLKQRDKFNAILEEELSARNHNYIMDINDKLDIGCFDRHGYLTPRGMELTWIEIDQIIKSFDFQEISLKPSAVISEATRSKDKKNKHTIKEPRRLLPAPPPKESSNVRQTYSHVSSKSYNNKWYRYNHGY